MVPSGGGPKFKPRQIIEADLKAVLHVREHTSTTRRCVVVEVDQHSNRMVIVFAAYEAYHHEVECYCIEPGTKAAEPFGDWLTKSTHFSPHNVVDAPLTLDALLVGAVPRGYPDQFDEFFPVCVYADLHSMVKPFP